MLNGQHNTLYLVSLCSIKYRYARYCCTPWSIVILTLCITTFGIKSRYAKCNILSVVRLNVVILRVVASIIRLNSPLKVPLKVKFLTKMQNFFKKLLKNLLTN
jgi:hypothetical protein